MNYKIFISFSLLLFASCKSSQKIFEAPMLEEELLDTLYITETAIPEPGTYELPLYQESNLRTHDLLHTKLDLSFDWQNQLVHGKANLTLKPYFYSSDILELDAKNFLVHRIEMNDTALKYGYDNAILTIHLDKKYDRNESYTLNIDYTAQPNLGPSSGSQAITSDKGLFFINPLNDHENKPQQIWTQGETEHNSRWFPTIDSPNERCSQEIYLTVDDQFKTLSNGLLISSTPNEDGTRTDYWKQDKPHAPYLFMIAIGKYSVVMDKWKNIPLYYYVEPEFEEHAKKIFNHTPEMINFFSEKLSYPFPWDKYAQVVCRDYVSGAMENTGAVIFGEFVQKTSRELLDSNNDDIVAHELFHHWFGDLVTCESWSNLTLNEGFATYSEYLWQEYKYGHDAAEKKRIEDLNGYLMSAAQGGHHDLIDFSYDNSESMFDAHSYNKGGLIVHMLRSYVGDDAFYTALNLYLKRHEYTDVEAHELRMAFEDTTGEDLNWFFNQWFFNQGHPILNVDYNIDVKNKQVSINAEQVQDPESYPAIFQFPVDVALYYPSGKSEKISQWINQREQKIIIDIESDEMPIVAVLDGEKNLLGVIHDNYTDEDHFNLFLHSKEYEDKYRALKALKRKKKFSSVFARALKDPSSEIRSMAISNVDAGIYAKELKAILQYDSHPFNRAKALKKLRNYSLAETAISKDKSYRVIGNALDIIFKQNPDKAIHYANEITKDYYKPLVGKIAQIYASSANPKYLPFFEKNLERVDYFEFFSFVSYFEKLASKARFEDLIRSCKVLQKMAMDNSSNYFKKYACTNLINNLVSELKSNSDKKALKNYADTVVQLENIMTEIISTTEESRLKSSFERYNTP